MRPSRRFSSPAAERRSAAAVLVVIALASCSDESHSTLVLGEDAPNDLSRVAVLVRTDDGEIEASGLMPFDEIASFPFSDVRGEVTVVAFTDERLARVELPDASVLAASPLRFTTPTATRLPKASWVGRGRTGEDAVVLTAVSEDVAVTADWLPECSLDPCALVPIEQRLEVIEVPDPGSVRALLARGPDSAVAVVGSDAGTNFWEVSRRGTSTMLSSLSSSAYVLYAFPLVDGEIATVTSLGVLSLGTLEEGFTAVATASVPPTSFHLDASPVEKEIVFAAGTGEILRWRASAPAEVEEIYRVRGALSHISISYLDSSELVVSHHPPGELIFLKNDEVRQTLPLTLARLVRPFRDGALVAADRTGTTRAALYFYRDDVITPYRHPVESRNAAREIWQIDEDSFWYGGIRGELFYVHHDAGMCELNILPNQNLSGFLQADAGVFFGLSRAMAGLIESIVFFAPYRETPRACALD